MKKKISISEWQKTVEGRKAYTLMMKAGDADSKKIDKMSKVSLKKMLCSVGI